MRSPLMVARRAGGVRLSAHSERRDRIELPARELGVLGGGVADEKLEAAVRQLPSNGQSAEPCR